MAHKESGVNWFGQVGGGGRATQPRPQVAAPSLSQIPGLSKASGDTSYTDEPQRPFYRDTDSAYVRLAKQGGRTDLLRMDQDAAPAETKGSGYTIPSWMQKDSVNEDMHNAELDFNDNASRADQWDSRQSSPPPPGDQGSNYSWSRKMSAEGDRQPMQTESQSAYANKQSRDVESPANWRSDQFQQQYSRQNISDAASEASRSSYQSPEHKARDNTRPDWLQWNPANNGRRESANGRQYEENAESRGSAYGQRYQGNGSPQKPFADHGYQLPMSTETSSAYSEKPFQSPAGGRRSSTSKEDFYSKSTYPASSSSQQRPSLTPNHEQQPAGINRLKHADSMSKIMSFGYLKDAEQGDSNHLGAGRSQPRLDQDYVANTYTTEYKEKMHHGTGDATPTNSIRSQNTGINSTGGYVPTPISDPGYRRRRQSMDERPDFFKIGSTEPQSVPAYGIRKPSAESRPDFFGSDRGSTAAALSYGKIKHDAETKPDFFKNGSLDNYMERQVEDKKPDDGGILDKLNGYHGISQKANFRRRKMDINGPMLTMPVKAISRF